MSDKFPLCKSIFQSKSDQISSQTFTQAFLKLVCQMEHLPLPHLKLEE